MKHRGLFISATDTGVGKTIVTALLLAYLRERRVNAIAMKPISSGNRTDARLLRALTDSEVSLDDINPIHFRHPLAPLVASRLEKRRLDLASVHSAIGTLQSAFPIVLIEGIGGLMVPLRRDYFVRDFVRDLGLPLLIVARPSLGTLNHTALTVEAARAKGIHIIGITLNDAVPTRRGLAERTNPAVLEETCGVPVVARIPHLAGMRPVPASVRTASRLPHVRRTCARIVAAAQFRAVPLD